MSRICLTLPGPDCAANAEHILNCEGTFSALEFRLDRILNDLTALGAQLSELSRNPTLMKALSLNCAGDFSIILTLRRKEDGGEFTGSVSEGESVLLEVLEKLCEDAVWPVLQRLIAVDVENQSDMPELFSFMRERHIPRISSLHYFDTCPVKPMDILENLPSIPKLTIMVKNLEDLNRIIETGQSFASRFPRRPFILIAMGVHGAPSRILPEKVGSWISFAGVGDEIAPGQLPSTEVMSYRSFPPTQSTALFAIIGKPVSHSRSPAYHNKFFTQRGLQALYIPLHCDEVPGIPTFARLMNLKGASVTIPHKEAIRDMLDGESTVCTVTTACNTIYMDKAGTWQGENTDVEGFLQPIRSFLKQYSQKKLRATVIGAGGAAKSVVYALLSEGAELLLLNRNIERAEKLAKHMNGHFAGSIHVAALNREALPLMYTFNDLVVQTTSVGMENGVHNDPLPFYEFKGSEFVYDIIYNPPVTPIMKRATDAGCTCINGWEMFLAQAELQAKIFERCLKDG